MTELKITELTIHSLAGELAELTDKKVTVAEFSYRNSPYNDDGGIFYVSIGDSPGRKFHFQNSGKDLAALRALVLGYLQNQEALRSGEVEALAKEAAALGFVLTPKAEGVAA